MTTDSMPAPTADIDPAAIPSTAYFTNRKAARRKHFAQANQDELPLHLKYLSRLQLPPLSLQPPTYDVNPLTLNTTCGIDWSALPLQVNPVSYLPAERFQRKQQQLSNMIAVLDVLLQKHCTLNSSLSKSSLHIVDFCAGSGHLGFLLAVIYPQHTVTLVEHNIVAVEQAQQRKSELGIDNVQVLHHSIHAYNESFDIGCGLHACGALTDSILDKCIQHDAAYLLCSCCVGKINNTVLHQQIGTGISLDIQYPRSKQLSAVFTPQEYGAFTTYSDYAHTDHTTSHADSFRQCKQYVEYDRIQRCMEHGYRWSMMTQMTPASASAKNDIIAGVK